MRMERIWASRNGLRRGECNKAAGRTVNKGGVVSEKHLGTEVSFGCISTRVRLVGRRR